LMYVVPSRSSASRKLRAPSRVAGRSPTTPISRSTRSRPLRRAIRVTSSARFARCVRAPTAGLCQADGFSKRLRTAAASSPAETGPSNFALMRPSEPTRNTHGSVGRRHSRMKLFNPNVGSFRR
jgi:hypothetical protein